MYEFLSKLLLYSRAELVLQEHIEYNDIVKSIGGETNSSLKDDEILCATGNANSKQNHGTYIFFFLNFISSFMVLLF